MKNLDGPATVMRIYIDSLSQITCTVRLNLILREMEANFLWDIMTIVFEQPRKRLLFKLCSFSCDYAQIFCSRKEGKNVYGEKKRFC